MSEIFSVRGNHECDYRYSLDQARERISTLEQENARLRGALEDAEEALTQVCVDINAPYVGKCWCSIADLTDKATWKAVLAARAALSGAPKEGT